MRMRVGTSLSGPRLQI